MYRSAKTAAILAAFMTVSGAAVMMAGCGQEEKDKGDELKDENGRTYHLVKNEDGTETAKYDNGEEVTFRRDENDNLQYVSGVSSLLPLLMMSYFMFHGLPGYSGHYDRNTGSVLNDRPAYTEQKQQQNAGGAGTGTYAGNKNSSYESGKSSGNSTVKAPAGGKTGFGGAGVRGRRILMEKTFMDDLDRNIFPYVEYPGYPFRYPTHLPLIVTRKQIEEVRRVSGALYRIFTKAAKRAMECDDSFMDDMEIPEKLRKYLHGGNAMKDLPTWISRFDYVIDEKTGGIRMVEINADTPCAEIEAYYANGVAGRYFGKENPNAFEMNGLRSFLLDVYLCCCGNMSSEELEAHPILFSCFHDYIEDFGTTKFLMNAMKEAVPEDVRPHILFESFYNLAVMEDGSVALPDGRTVSFLYRMHPMEILIEETADQDGSSLGELMMEGYVNHRFHMMNPPESIIMQSKGFQALLYALMEDHAFFTEKEQEIIRNYIPASFFMRDFQMDEKSPSLWIRKPIWGREGRGIDIINEKGETVYRKEVEDPEDVVCRDSDSSLVQQYVPQQKIVTKTDVGVLEGYVTLSCFMLGDKPSAIYARFSEEKIAGNEAYWIPVLYE